MSADTHGLKRYTTGPLSLQDAKTRADRLEALLANHQRNGGADMTTREACEAFQRVYGVELFPHHGEAGLGALEAAQRVLCEREHKRPCRVTGVTVKTWRVAEKQVELI